jgi:uncharacterized membrane protein YvbJ
MKKCERCGEEMEDENRTYCKKCIDEVLEEKGLEKPN